MNGVERLLRSVDHLQQRSRWLGFPFAVMRKFRDDHGGMLTTVVVYNARSRTRQLSNHTGRDPAARQVKELARPADPARTSVRYKSTAIGSAADVSQRQGPTVVVEKEALVAHAH